MAIIKNPITVPSATLSGNAAVTDVLSGKTFYNTSTTKLTGTMTNTGAVTSTITAQNGAYTIPEGYHNGSGVVTAILPSKSAQTYTPTTSNQTIASGKYLAGEQTILGDADLVAANIKKDVAIFGVTGTYEGSASGSMPTLRTVTISRSGSTLTISNPSSNGTFVTGYKIYSNETLIQTQTSATFNLDTLDAGVHSITVRAYGTNFNDSNASSAVSYSIYSISNVLTDITNSNTATKIGMTQAYTGTLSAVTGKYLPYSITITMGGQPAEFAYDDLTGEISISSVTGDVVITATAESQAGLSAPVIDLTGSILSWTSVTNATGYSIRCDGEEVATSTGLSIDISTLFSEDGVYVMTVVATANGYRDSNASNTVSYAIGFLATLADNTWGQIAAAAEAGTAGSIWAVGDEKDVTLTTGETITLRILGFNHDTKTAGGTAGITFGMKNLLAATYYMNSDSSNEGGWGSSYMRNTTIATLYALLPAEVQAVIKPVNKLTSAGNTSSTINTTSDSLFLLSEIEVFGVVNRSFDGEGSQYAWFAAHKTAVERIKYLSNGTGSAYSWWLRSPFSAHHSAFCGVNNNGNADTTNANSTRGVALGFCV